MNYEDMLSKARKKIPEPEESKRRFQVPKVSGRIEGGRTIITNFHEVADALRRDPAHLLKFLNKELATPGKIEGKSARLKRRLRPAQLNSKIKEYEKTFVECMSCGKSDTVMNRDGDRYTIKCQACGAQNEFTLTI